MKLSSINSVKVQQNTSTNNNPNLNKTPVNSNVSFKGAESLVNFWQFVDNGGRAMQFTVEDMCGTNIWRTFKGFMAGIKYTHKLNIPAGLQEMLREFLTGPLMCVMPVIILKSAISLTGESANTHVENLENLSHIMKKVQPDLDKNFKDGFFNAVVEDMLQKSTGKSEISQSDIDVIKEAVKNYSNSTDKKDKAKILGEIQKTFENIVKNSIDNYKNTDFTQVKYTIKEGKAGSTKLKNYIGYMSAYANDAAKKCDKEGIDINNLDIKAFKNNWVGKRLITAFNMFLLTGAALSIVPKIYTKASGKINPNAAAIYNEAEAKNNKEVK